MAAEPRLGRPGRRGIGYGRKSPKGGGAAAQHYEDVSLGLQEEAIRERAKTDDIDLLDYREERHVRYDLHARKVLMDILEECRQGLWDFIVAYDPYRWSGDPDHASWLRVECDRAGVTVRLCRDDPGEGRQGQLLNYVSGYVSKVEYENIKDRTGRGKRARLEAGKSLPHPSPYGYRWNHEVDPASAPLVADRYRDLHVYEPEAKIVRRMYALVDGGLSSAGLTRQLNELGLPGPNGGAWRQGSVARMLRNVAYLGHDATYQTRRQQLGRGESARRAQRPAPRDEWRVVEGKHPALVDVAQWERVWDTLDRNRSHPRRTDIPVDGTNGPRYLLTGGLAVCAGCQGALVGRCSTPLKSDRLGVFAPGQSVRYYVCPSTNAGRKEMIRAGRAPACPAPATVRADVLDREAWRQVLALRPPGPERRRPQKDGRRERERDLTRLAKEETKLRQRLDNGLRDRLDTTDAEERASLQRIIDACKVELAGVVAEREKLHATERTETADTEAERAYFALLSEHAEHFAALVPWGAEPGQDAEMRAVLRALRARAVVRRYSDLRDGERWFEVGVGHVADSCTTSAPVDRDMLTALRAALARP